MSYHRYTRGVVLALLLGTLFSCSNGVPSTDAGVTTVTTDPGSTSTSISATTTTTAEGAAPAEIQGGWTADEGNAETIVFLGPTTYSFHGTNEGGRISVEGDIIEFHESVLCEGTGAYRWSLDGDTLTFTAVEPLDCPDRRGLLDGKEFTR